MKEISNIHFQPVLAKEQQCRVCKSIHLHIQFLTCPDNQSWVCNHRCLKSCTHLYLQPKSTYVSLGAWEVCIWGHIDTTKPRDPYSAFCQCAYTTKPRDPYSASTLTHISQYVTFSKINIYRTLLFLTIQHKSSDGTMLHHENMVCCRGAKLTLAHRSVFWMLHGRETCFTVATKTSHGIVALTNLRIYVDVHEYGGATTIIVTLKRTITTDYRLTSMLYVWLTAGPHLEFMYVVFSLCVHSKVSDCVQSIQRRRLVEWHVPFIHIHAG